MKFGKDAPIVLHPIQPQARFGIMTDINVGSNAPKLIVTKTPFKVNGQKFNTVRLVEEAQGKYSARFGNTTHSVDEGMEMVEDSKAYKVDFKHEDFKTGIKIYGKEGQHAMTAYSSGLIFSDETEIQANPYQTTRRYGINTYLNPVESLKLTLSGVTDILSGAGVFMSLIPCENPFAQVIGYECADAKKGLNRVKCHWDNVINPMNSTVLCEEVLEVFNITPTSGGKENCAVKLRNYSFEAGTPKAKAYLKQSQYFKDPGFPKDPKSPQADFYKTLKQHEIKKIEEKTGTYPEEGKNYT